MTAIDPSVMTVADVEAWVEANWHDHRNDATFVAVHDAERDGKARVSLLDWLDHFAEDHDIDVTPTPRTPGLPIMLMPSTAHVDDPDFVISVIGVGFNDTSVIVWGGGDEPTTFVSDTEVRTGVKPSTAAGPGDEPVHVRTTVDDGEGGTVDEDSATAMFTFLAKSLPDPMVENAVLTAQLRSWGLSGEPITWVILRQQPIVSAIRLANTGFGTVATVDGLLDSLYPLNNIDGADVCVTPTAAVAQHAIADGRSRFTVAGVDPKVPDDHITWLVDGVTVGQGRLLDRDPLPPGRSYQVEVRVSVSGVTYNSLIRVDR